VLQQGLQSRKIDENHIENMDETHFVFNIDNGKTIGNSGDEVVKYAEVKELSWLY
jgi:hypothetical protein